MDGDEDVCIAIVCRPANFTEAVGLQLFRRYTGSVQIKFHLVSDVFCDVTFTKACGVINGTGVRIAVRRLSGI